MRVNQTMSRNVYTITPDISLLEAFTIMQEAQIRHLPVIEEGQALVGIISERDLLLRASYEDGEIVVSDEDCVKDVMITDIITATEETSIGEAALAMVNNKIDCLPVIQSGSGGHLVGMITSTDLLGLIGQVFANNHHESLPFTFNIITGPQLSPPQGKRPWA